MAQDVPDEWDDTDLLKVWDDCVAEYKKYHSIAANGGPVRLLETTSVAEADEEYEPEDHASDSYNVHKQHELSANQNQGHEKDPLPTNTPNMQMPPLPPNMAEHLKAMALSWYYAGYYAGVAEGYAKAWAEGDGAI